MIIRRPASVLIPFVITSAAAALSDTSEDLARAIGQGDVDALGAVIDRSPDAIDRPVVGTLLPLTLAVGADRPEIVELLLDRGATVDKKDGLGNPALFYAATTGNVRIAQQLLDHGAMVDARNVERWTPLAAAAKNGKLEAAEVLLGRGADWHLRDGLGFTPFHTAVEYGHISLVELLLAKGADIDQAVGDGRMPIHLAVQSGVTDIVALLLEQGASIESVETNGATPLLMASIGGRVGTVSLLIEAGADVNTVDQNGHTTLMGPVMGMMLGQTMDPNNKRDRLTHLATAEEAATITAILLGHGVDVSAVDAQIRRSALHWAAIAGATQCVQLLLERGAEPNAEDARGVTPIRYAIAGERHDVVLLLARAGAYVSRSTMAEAKGRMRGYLWAGRGHWQTRREQYREAKGWLEGAYIILEYDLGLAHETTRQTMASLVSLYEASGEESHAADWAERLEFAKTFDPVVISADYRDSRTPEELARDATGDDARTKRNAILAIRDSEFGGEAAYRELYCLNLDRSHHDVRVACLAALARHGTADDVAAIQPLTKDQDESIRVAAESALAELAARLEDEAAD